MNFRRGVGILLLVLLGGGVALLGFSRFPTVAGLLALTVLGFFWVLLPTLFLAFLAWSQLKELKPRWMVKEDLGFDPIRPTL